MEMEPNKMLFNFKEEFTSLTSFILFMIPIFEGKDLFPHNGDILIPNATRSKIHIVHFFVP
jgi:hypothetical protein